jgi:DNA-directed RNA polymerase specialized sigma24 family protein
LSERAWLLGTLIRTFHKMLSSEKNFLGRTSISLDTPVPPEPVHDDQDAMYQWHQPDMVLRWEDVVPEEAAKRQAAMLHGAHGLSAEEIAIILGYPIHEVEEILENAPALKGEAPSWRF